ncbi:MAG: OmpA family protein [Bacteroidales bacterium]|nr:OmpA family protein [Bacteroidales bacterium]
MKILISGFLVFVCWASLSSYLYVCKIKGLCNEKDTAFVSNLAVNDTLSAVSTPDTLALQADLKPDSLLIYFAFDKSSFVADSSISAYYDKSVAYLLRYSAAGLHITGHTDAKGSDEYNKALGYRRARSVQVYFENKGFPPEKITIDSRGEKEPAETNNTDEGRAKNRRASVTVKNKN